MEPLEVATLDLERELIVLPDRAVANLVHLVELALEDNEVTTSL